MALTITVDGSAAPSTIAPESVTAAQCADMGEAAFGGFDVDDAAAWESTGWKLVTIEESACTAQPRLFTGYVGQRDYGRSTERGMLVNDDRVQDVTLTDLNSALRFVGLSGSTAKRPAETWTERLTWLLSQPAFTMFAEDTGYVMSLAVERDMDAANYLGYTVDDVLRDLCERVGDRLQYFLFWDAAANSGAGAVSLFLDYQGAATNDAGLAISNDPADIDLDTVFAPDTEAKLSREPDEVYSEVRVDWANGSVVVRRPSTEAAYVRRTGRINRPYIKTKARALQYAEAFLDRHDQETDRITCTIIVPASKAGLVTAGQRITVKFTHLPGYENGASMRVAQCIARPLNDVAAYYALDLELLFPKPAALGPGGDPVASGAAVLFSDTGCGGGSFPRVPLFTHTGDVPPSGWTSYPTFGLLEPHQCSAGGGYIGVRSLGAGDVSIEHHGAFAGVAPEGATVTWSLYVNDTEVASDSWVETRPGLNGASEVTYLLAEDVAVVLGDIIYVKVAVSGWSPYYRRISVPWNPSLKVWGDLTADEDETEDLGSGQYQTVEADAPPTVNDDAGEGYVPGQTWVDQTTGIGYILIDATEGAAVWQPVPRNLDDLEDVDAAAPSDGDVLTWDDGAGEWVPAAAGGGGDVATDAIWDAAGDLAVGSGANTAARLAVGSEGQVLSVVSGAVAWDDLPSSLTPPPVVVVVDGGGEAITSGAAVAIPLTTAGEFTAWTIVADQSGSIEFDLQVDSYANYPPTSGDSIVGAAPPAITGAAKGTDSTLTGWSPTFAAGDVLRVVVSAATTVEHVTLTLERT